MTFVVEKDEVDALVASVAELQKNADPVAFLKVTEIVLRYQELPQLLDPHLEGWITPLAGVLRAEAHKGDDADMVLVQRTAKALNALATVRGAKTVVKFFPHEARDLEPVVALLVRSHDAQLCATTLEEKDELGTAWETRAVLILWLSILVLIPFDLVTVDSLARECDDAEAPPVVMRILRLCQDRYLSDPGIVRDRAATLLARLLTRPDMPRALASFLDWATEALAKANAPHAPEDDEIEKTERAKAFAAAEQKATFLVPGVARALAAIFKLGTRGALLGVAERAWGDARDLAESPAARGSALVRQLACKLAQRIGLLFLKPRVVAWRYERGARSLVDNLRKNDGDVSGGAATGNVPETPTSSESATRAVSTGQASDDDDDDDDVPDGVEEVIESLLVALRDKDTVVRWSAAKGLGRITARLPAEFGDEVVGSILECFALGENENTRHGACLALAELARRGLLLPERLPDAVPHVAEALTYDVRRGPHSVGAHVRDAAAYVCWAFARAYAPEALSPHAPALGPALLVAACFDREVNCRRAAAAAFQEAVGRLGAFPHGMDVVSAADYFALGARANAFTRVADFVCALDEYRPALLEHLLFVKLAHWERRTRELAARALGVVGQRDRDWTRATALPVLLDRALSPAMETRHGAVVGAAEALLALRGAPRNPERKEPERNDAVLVSSGGVVDGALAERVVTLVRDVEKARLYRGKGGEAMRAATCRFVECLAMTGQPLDRGPGPAAGPKSLRSALLASMEESLRHPSADVRDAATRALGAFAEAYMCGSSPEKGAERLVVTLAATAEEDPNPAARRGAAAALGAMPAALLLAAVPSRKRNGNGDPDSGANGETGSDREFASEQKPVTVPAWRAAMDALAAASRFEEDPEARDAEARVCAVKGAAGVARALCAAATRARRGGGEAAAAAAAAAATVADETLRVCVRCIQEDYCVDNRGDVGSWVREAAMDAIPDLVAAARVAAGDDAETGKTGAETSETLRPERVNEIVSALLKQAAEKIDRVRAAAGAALTLTLRGDEARARAPLRGVPAGEALLAAVPESAGAAAWAAPSSAFPALAKLVAADDDSRGLATYRRSLLEGFVVSAGGVGDSLGKAAGGALVAALRDDPELQRDVFKTLVAILDERAGVDRVTTPLLRALDACFSAGCLGAVAPAPPAPPAPLAAALAAKLRAELKGSRDVAKLCLGVQALCHLAGLGKAGAGPAHDEATCASTCATMGVLALLVNRYPRVRRVAAEQLYVTLLGCEGEDAGTEEAIELLSATRWDADLAAVKPARNALYPMLGLETPKQALVAAKAKAASREARDENDSYAALVGSAGY